MSDRANVALVCGGCQRPAELILGAPIVNGRIRTKGMQDALYDHVLASPTCGGADVLIHSGPAIPEAYAQLRAQVSACEGRR